MQHSLAHCLGLLGGHHVFLRVYLPILWVRGPFQRGLPAEERG